MRTLDHKKLLCERSRRTACPLAVKVSAYQVMEKMIKDFEKVLNERDKHIKMLEDNIVEYEDGIRRRNAR